MRCPDCVLCEGGRVEKWCHVCRPPRRGDALGARLLLGLAVIAIAAFAACPAHAQERGPRYPDWRPLATRIDGSIQAPKVILSYVDLTLGIWCYDGAKLVGLSDRAASHAGAFTCGAVPHLIGWAKRSYGVDPMDWVADYWWRGGVAYVKPACNRRIRSKACLVRAGVYVAGAAALFGYQR